MRYQDVLPGSSPGGSRVIRRGDRVDEYKTYLFINIRLDQEEIVQQENLVEKRGLITWYTWKANKVPDKELAPSMLGHRRPFEYRRVPRLGLSLLWISEAGTSKQTWRASMPQMGIQPEIRVKRRHGGNQSSDWLCPLLFRRPFILLIIHGDQWVTQSQQSRLLSKPGFSLCIPNCIHKSQVIYIIFGQKGQLTFYSLFSDKGVNQKTYLC